MFVCKIAILVSLAIFNCYLFWIHTQSQPQLRKRGYFSDTTGFDIFDTVIKRTPPPRPARSEPRIDRTAATTAKVQDGDPGSESVRANLENIRKRSEPQIARTATTTAKVQDSDSGSGSARTNLEAIRKRLFTEEVTPPTDSSCQLPHIPVVIKSPSVTWIPCAHTTPRFTNLADDGKSIVVNCSTAFRVSTTNTQWKYYDPVKKVRLYYKDMYLHKRDRMRYIQRPAERWETRHPRNSTISFDSRVVKVKCGKWYNFHSRYMPDPEKAVPSTPLKSKPTIVHIMTDAFPRASFFRKSQGWPNVAKLLERMWARKDTMYQSFVFNRYVSQSMNTIENLVPMYGGVPHDTFHLIENGGLAPTLVKKNPSQDIKMIWDYANEYGYQMLMGDEMTNSPQRVMMDSPHLQFFTSHNRDVFNDFPQKAAGREGELRHMQCYGAEHAVQHELRETLQFLNQSLGVPKFTFLTMKQAHSKWPGGNQNDMIALEFMEALLKRKEDVALFIASDHGYGYQDKWGKNPKRFPGGEYERLLPFMGIVVPNTMLRKLGKTHLFTNQQRLVSCFDINLTFQALMAGYELMRTDPNLQRRAIPGKAGGTALNLITQEVPKNRTCKEAGIRDSACVCSKWHDVAPSEYRGPRNVYMNVLEAALDFINRQRAGPDSSCYRLTKNASVVVKAAAKAHADIGYAAERTSNRRRVISIKFDSAWGTKWSVVASAHLGTKGIKLFDVIPLHRFSHRKACWDGNTPLRYCACDLAVPKS